MEQRCTCGAVLPDDARFCHKCGKPQYEEDIARLSFPEPQPSIPSTPRAPAQPPVVSGISFRNSQAVLISLLVAGVSFIVLLVASVLAPLLFPVVLCAAGFTAARLYGGGAPEPLTTVGGARLGWMTGLWLFIVMALLFAFMAVMIASPQGWEQLRASSANLPQGAAFRQLTQHDLLVRILIALPFSFFLLTILPGLGGILGAKWSPRRHTS